MLFTYKLQRVGKMSGINNIQDEKIRQVAMTLKQSGLAASETEAIRMATSMTSTNSKVQQAFQDKKERNIMGLAYLRKQPEQHTTTPEQMTAQKIPVRIEEEEVAVKLPSSTTAPLSQDNKAENLNLDLDNEQEFLVQDVIKSDELPKPTPIQTESNQTAARPIQNPAPTERPAPKKDIRNFEESKVNLASVFSFKG